MNVVYELDPDNSKTYFIGNGLEGYLSESDRRYYSTEPNRTVYSVYCDDTANYENIGEYTYGGYGDILTGIQIDNPFKFAGEYNDDETGLIYLRNRYYDPHTGRFISEDPAMDDNNWYIYCNNNPINFVDPWGLDATATGNIYDIFMSYWEMQMLTDDRLQFNSVTGEIAISALCTGVLSKPAGTELVREILNNHDYMLTIHRNRGNQTVFSTNGSRNSYIDISDEYNSNTSAFLLVSNEEGVNVFQSFADTPSYIFLGHEMIHALHHMKGIKGIPTSFRYYRDHQGNIGKEKLELYQADDEFETVGLYYISMVQNPLLHKKINPPYFTRPIIGLLQKTH